MEYFNNILCVTYGELTCSNDGEAVVSISNYKALLRRSVINVCRPGKGLDHPALIEWASVPTRFREKFVLKYGDPETIMLGKMNEMKMDDKAREFFRAYTLEDGGSLKEDKQKEYTINASVLNRLIDNENKQKACRGMCSNTTPVNWDAIYNLCDDLREEWGHTLPKNRLRLRDKIREYKSQGYKCLVSGKIGSSNAVKLTPEVQQWAVSRMRNRMHRYTVQSLFREYNRIAPDNGWKPVKTAQTFVNFLFKEDIRPLWEDTKIGELAVRAKLQRQSSFSNSMRRDALWYSDGTVMNLYYKAFVNGSWKPVRLWVYEVMDAATEVLLGYSIGSVENFSMMYEAVIMALQTSGHKPYQFGYDNQGGTKQEIAKRWLQKVSNISYHTAPFHGNSKTIESGFGRFQALVLAECFNYSGGNVKAKSMAAQIDTEWVRKNVNMLPDYEGVIRQYLECRRRWNEMPMRGAEDMSRWEYYQSTVNENTSEITPEIMTDIRMLFCKKPVEFTASGLCFEINGKTYRYEVMMPGTQSPDRKWGTEHTGTKFEIEYDPSTVGQPDSFIRLYKNHGPHNGGLQYITDAKPKRIIPRDAMSQSLEDKQWLQEQIRLDKKERVRQQLARLAIDEQYGILPEKHGFISPGLQGLSDREFEMFADEIRREQEAAAKLQQAHEPEPFDMLEDSLGVQQKVLSSEDRFIDAYDRM